MAPLSPDPGDTGEADPAGLVCSACGASPRALARSRALNLPIHTALADRQGGVDEICGGIVVPAAEAWRAALQPGVVVPASPLKRVGAHLVRLGRAANRRNQSWTGTPLCGLVQSGAQHWVPLAPDVVDRMQMCRKCADARDAGAAD